MSKHFKRIVDFISRAQRCKGRVCTINGQFSFILECHSPFVAACTCFSQSMEQRCLQLPILNYQYSLTFSSTFHKYVRWNLYNHSLIQILVHCTAGASRAPSAVMAYLVAARMIPLVDAFEYVRALRPLTSPNNRFLLQLALLEVSEGMIFEVVVNYT